MGIGVDFCADYAIIKSDKWLFFYDFCAFLLQNITKENNRVRDFIKDEFLTTKGELDALAGV